MYVCFGMLDAVVEEVPSRRTVVKYISSANYTRRHSRCLVRGGILPIQRTSPAVATLGERANLFFVTFGFFVVRSVVQSVVRSVVRSTFVAMVSCVVFQENLTPVRPDL